MIFGRLTAMLLAGGSATMMLLVAADPASRCRAAGWADSRTVGSFVCRADFPLDGLENLLTDLGKLQADLVQALGVPAAQEPIELYLFHDQAVYARYLSRYLPNVPYRRALYVKSRGPGKVFAYRSRDFERDLQHECTHALLHASLPLVPLWLDEGLAEYFELPGGQRVFGSPNFGGIRDALRRGSVPPLETLEKKASLSEMGKSEYQASWAWVHFMLHGPAPAHEELVAFLADIRSGTPPGVLSTRLRGRLPEAERLLAEHFRRYLQISVQSQRQLNRL